MKIIGIYKLTSPNGKIYIGQSWNIYDRWSDYKKIRFNSIGRRLYNSLKKYKPENFIFEIIYYAESSVTQEELDNLELSFYQKYIDLGYIMLNSRECGGSKGKHSEETKKLMSLASKGKPKSELHKLALKSATRVNHGQFWKGKEFSKEHKDKLRKPKFNRTNSLKGIKRPIYSESFKKDYRVINKNIETIYHLSKTDLRILLGLSLKTFNKLLSGKKCKKIKEIEIYEFNK